MTRTLQRYEAKEEARTWPYSDTWEKQMNATTHIMRRNTLNEKEEEHSKTTPATNKTIRLRNQMRHARWYSNDNTNQKRSKARHNKLQVTPTANTRNINKCVRASLGETRWFYVNLGKRWEILAESISIDFRSHSVDDVWFSVEIDWFSVEVCWLSVDICWISFIFGRYQ